MPIAGTCKRCFDKMSWRKKYRKYKPLTQPATCVDCRKKNVKAAYHKLCNECAQKKGACPICVHSHDIYMSNKKKKALDAKKNAAEAAGVDIATVEKLLNGESISMLSERERRSAMRKAERVTYSYGGKLEDDDSEDGYESHDSIDVEKDSEDELF